LQTITRRSVVGALVGLAFAAAAGVGLAQITAGSATTVATTTTSESQTTSTPTTGDSERESADDQESATEDSHFESTVASTISTTMPGGTTTSRDDSASGSGNAQTKVDVCHRTGSGKKHTINIATPAVPAHVAHGDTIGACALVAPATTTTAKRIAAAKNHLHKPQRPGKAKKPRKEHGPKLTGAGTPSQGNSGHAHEGGDHANSSDKGHGKP
jgi:hypothetical protein